MKKLRVTVSGVLLLAMFVFHAAAQAEPYQVTFATMECSGATGFATVGIDQIYKFQAAGCAGPDGKQLQQLLVHNGSGSYSAYTLTETEAENVNKEIKAYMAARRGILERSDAVIVKP